MMESIRNEFQQFSESKLIDLLLAKAAELLNASDAGENETVTRLTREMQGIHELIKEKRGSGDL